MKKLFLNLAAKLITFFILVMAAIATAIEVLPRLPKILWVRFLYRGVHKKDFLAALKPPAGMPEDMAELIFQTLVAPMDPQQRRAYMVMITMAHNSKDHGALWFSCQYCQARKVVIHSVEQLTNDIFEKLRTEVPFEFKANGRAM